VGADDRQGGTVELVGQAVQARGLVGGGLQHSGLQFCKGEGDLEAVTLFWRKLRQIVQELWEGKEIRGEGGTTINRVAGGVGGGNVAALENGGEEAENLFLDRGLRT
jgi:hypothetical protein